MIRKSIVFLLAICFYQAAIAQVTGVIRDAESGEFLVGATVQNISGQANVVSDAEGRFSLDISLPDSLVISYLGYVQRKVWATAPFATYFMEEDVRTLKEVIVVAFESGKSLSETAGAISQLNSEDIRAYDNTSIVAAMNTLPGVQMEQRSPGSYRINIRGSSIRAPFDVRNVKVYWNGIPFTEPGGSTSFNFFDPINFGQVEVVRGPASSSYGAGNGGVLNIKSMKPGLEENSAEVGMMAGSFGLWRQTASVKLRNGGSQSVINYAHQKTEGYRDHTNFDRHVFEYSGKFHINDKQRISANLLYTDLFYQIPGGLNKAQYDTLPTQARPGTKWTMGSVESNASVSVKNLLLGVSHQYAITDNFQNTTTIYSMNSDFKAPFLFDYKRDAHQGAGGRTSFSLDKELGSNLLKLAWGGEYQHQLTSARNYGNNSGVPDTLNFEDEVRMSQGLAFLHAGLELEGGISLDAGLSYNNINYDIYRLYDAELDTSFQLARNWSPVWAPRISVNYRINDQHSVYGALGYGFSPPTLDEVRTNEGSINTDLDPEVGLNYELGWRSSLLDRKLDLDLVAFYYQLKNTIVDYVSPRGTDLFRNAGSTKQLGVEWLGSYKVLENAGGFIPSLKVQGAYTYHYFNFNEYIINTDDFSGLPMPGIAPHTFSGKLDAKSKGGLYATLTWIYKDKIPLNNENTDFADNYNLVLVKAGIAGSLGKNMSGDFYAGVNNLFNEKYSLGNDLNPFGGRYYQPSPVRNFYIGAKLTFGR